MAVVDRSGHVWAFWRRFPGFWVAFDQFRHVCLV